MSQFFTEIMGVGKPGIGFTGKTGDLRPENHFPPFGWDLLEGKP